MGNRHHVTGPAGQSWWTPTQETKDDPPGTVVPDTLLLPASEQATRASLISSTIIIPTNQRNGGCDSEYATVGCPNQRWIMETADRE